MRQIVNSFNSLTTTNTYTEVTTAFVYNIISICFKSKSFTLSINYYIILNYFFYIYKSSIMKCITNSKISISSFICSNINSPSFSTINSCMPKLITVVRNVRISTYIELNIISSEITRCSTKYIMFTTFKISTIFNKPFIMFFSRTMSFLIIRTNTCIRVFRVSIINHSIIQIYLICVHIFKHTF